ncbi:MAG: 30S ribosomal protein S21 [Bacteroidota bacterium]
MREGNITVYVKDSESTDRAFRRFKRKCEKVKLSRQIRERMYYKKPSTRRREERLKAIYRDRTFPKR